jgi:SRSO17 transposase
MSSGNVVDESAKRFVAYVDGLASALGHADRSRPLKDYCTGLVLPGERKSVEPMAAVTAPARVCAQHQSLLHFVGEASWSDQRLLAKVRELVLPAMERQEPIAAWIIDDTGFPKKGKHSVGVARQYCGQLGKQDNCQTAVSLSIANHHASLPVAYRLYLPQEWAKDRARRVKAGVPKEIRFRTKPQLALEQIRAACKAGLPRGTVLMDAGYGANTKLRTSVTELGLTYVAGILPQTRMRMNGSGQAIAAGKLARRLPAQAWRTITWREGTAEKLSSRFARVRVRVAHRDALSGTRADEWLLIEWPKGEKQPTKYWLSTLPADLSFEQLVDTAKLRWRIERDYQELKQEVGLGHFEGRGWRGFHHHASLCIASYGFLISERETIPPSGPYSSRRFPQSSLPEGYRPRGAASTNSTPYSQLDSNRALSVDPGTGQKFAALPVL